MPYFETAGYNEVGEHGDDDDDAEGTVFDQAGGGRVDSGGLVRHRSAVPGGGVRDRAGGAGLWAQGVGPSPGGGPEILWPPPLRHFPRSRWRARRRTFANRKIR